MNKDKEFLQAKIDDLELSISDTRADFLIKLNELKSELGVLRKLTQNIDENIVDESVICSEGNSVKSSSDAPNMQQRHPDNEAKEQSVIEVTVSNKVEKESLDTVKIESNHRNEFHLQSKKSSDWNAELKEKPAEPSVLSSVMRHLLQSIIGFVLSRLTIFSAPFQELYHKLTKLYDHYQQQGKAPVFLMTVAGLITLSIGFGYLLQYSFNTLFNDALKAITGFVIGAGIIAVGALLAVKKTEFRDYAASVIALGVIFNYLTAYFIGPHYGLVSETIGFVLLMVVTVAAFSLALFFETRVVSAVTLVGGVFMPFIVGDAGSAGLVFLSYLLVLSVGNLYLSYKIKWPSLSQFTFFLTLSVVEYIGISEVIHPLLAITLLSAFFYMYTYYWTFDGVKLKDKLANHDLTILVANVFYFIYAVLQLPADIHIVAGVLIVHSIVLATVVKSLRLMQSVMAPMYLLYIGLLIATAVFVLTPADVTSIVWAIEGLAMLYIGFLYNHKVIRAEGYVIYVIAMTGLLWQAIEAFTSMSQSIIAWHWINLVAFGCLSFIAYRIIYQYKEDATAVEHKAAFVQNEIFTFWGALAISLVISIYATPVMTVLAAIPLMWCFYRVSLHKLRVAQITGYLFLLVFIAQILIGFDVNNTTVITQQSFVDWIAMLELVVFSWGIYLYYQHNNISGRGEVFSKKIHNLIFYFPLALIISSLINIFDLHYVAQESLEFSYLWLDFIVISALLYLAHRIVLQTESIEEGQQRRQHAYVLSETVSLLFSVFFLYTAAILLGAWVYVVAVMPLILLLYRGLDKKLPLTEKLSWLHFSIFVVLTITAHQSVGNLHFSEQTWSTRIAWVEVLLSAWAMKYFYDRTDYKKGLYDLACKVRVGVYLLIPVLFLPRVIRLYADYLPVALWCSFAISWLMYKKLKIEALLKELILLFLIASVSTVMISLNAISGSKELPGLIAILIGLLIISAFHYVEKTLSLKTIKDSSYHEIQLLSPYFYGFVTASLTYAVSHQILITLAMTGFYFLYIIQERRFLPVLLESIDVSYILSCLFLVSVPVLVFLKLSISYASGPSTAYIVAANIICLTGLWLLTHKRNSALRLLRNKYAGTEVQLWIFHFVVLLGYIGTLNFVFTSWAVGVSIFMLIHAVVVLFLTLNERYKGLLRLSIILYALTAAKVLIHDMTDFENLHKVIALMGIGSILMAAAFMFQKMQNKQAL
jgi:hypothetical protein